MRALVYTAPGRLTLEDIPEPELAADEVTVEVAACGVCGSDVHGFLGRSAIRIPPMVMGHEFSGWIVAAGANVRAVTLDERVVIQPVIGCGRCASCRAGRSNICLFRQLVGGHRPGGFAQYVTVPASAVYPISGGLDDVAATLVEPMGNAVHMLGLAGAGIYGRVVILGAGTLGLLTACLARLSGSRRVVVTDTDEHRLRVATRMGADVVLDARDPDTTARILDLTDGGADAVIDAAGVTASRRQAVAATKAGGTVVLLGTGEPESALPFQDIINREIVLRGSYSSTDDEFRRAIAVLEDGRVNTDGWVEPVALEQGQAIFERLSTDPSGLIKVLFPLR